MLAAPIMLWLAINRLGEADAAVLLVAGVTDVLDGALARRTGHESEFGARLDAAADLALLCGAALSLVVLHPAVSRDIGWLVASGAMLAAASVASQYAFGRVGLGEQLSSKAAGATLYGFALVTLWSGVYEPLLLKAAAAALAIASLETLLRSAPRLIPTTTPADPSPRS